MQPDLLCLSSFRTPLSSGMSPGGLAGLTRSELERCAAASSLAGLSRTDIERCTSGGFTRADIERCTSGGLTRADLERSGLTRADLERCKRDSGVLIEDTDATSDDNSTITMLSNIHQHFSHLRLAPPPSVNAILRQTTNSPRSLDGSISPSGTNSS